MRPNRCIDTFMSFLAIWISFIPVPRMLTTYRPTFRFIVSFFIDFSNLFWIYS